ncbi:MAG TPA: Fic family protein [Tepidisphaeraceae bacterium]|jgi:Fic family protein|nr:Fic family protein [Tepidisphaeraceae bacterium]
MKIPTIPPRCDDKPALSGLEIHNYFEVIHSKPFITYAHRYLHWDKLRRIPTPLSLTHEQWWCLTKSQRQLLLKPLPFSDRAGHPFCYAATDPAMEYLHGIDRIAAGPPSNWGEFLTNSSVKDQYIADSLMREAITSSQLEGASTTTDVAKQMLHTGRKPRTRDEQMIFNNYAAMRKIRSLVGRPLTPELVFELHVILTTETLDIPGAAGRFRKEDEKVVVADELGQVLHTPPPAGDLPSRLAAMCDFANAITPGYFLHPFVRATLLHFWLAYDHPFVDGNGRCARALFYWSALSSGYWLCEFLSISQLIRNAPVKYGRSFLYVETDDNDATYFVLYHLQLIQQAINELRDHLVQKQQNLREIESRLPDQPNLNLRQLALIHHALRHPGHSYTIKGHQASSNTVYETARTDLLNLVAQGYLTTTKRGRVFYFYPAKNLADHLNQP